MGRSLKADVAAYIQELEQARLSLSDSEDELKQAMAEASEAMAELDGALASCHRILHELGREE